MEKRPEIPGIIDSPKNPEEDRDNCFRQAREFNVTCMAGRNSRQTENVKVEIAPGRFPTVMDPAPIEAIKLAYGRAKEIGRRMSDELGRGALITCVTITNRAQYIDAVEPEGRATVLPKNLRERQFRVENF